MMTRDQRQRLIRLGLFSLSLLLLLTFARAAHADTYTWTGAGANAKWSTAANWQGNAAPNIADAIDDTLVFPAGAAQPVMQNDFPAGTRIGTLHFLASYSVSGNQIRIVDRIVVAHAAAVFFNQISCPLLLDAGMLGNTVTISANRLLDISGTVSGIALATLRVEGAVALTSPNGYQGSTVVATGTLFVTHPQALGATNAGTSVLAGGRLSIGVPGAAAISEPILLAGTGSIDDDGALQLAGPDLTLTNVALAGTEDVHIYVPSSTTLEIQDGIDGPTGLVKRGAGKVVMAGAANTFTGRVTNEAGLLVLNKAGAVAAPQGLTITGGTVRLGGANAIEGTVVINAPGILDLNDASDTVQSIEGSGEVQLGTATLTLAQSGNTDRALSFNRITGAGKVIVDGSNIMTLTGASTFTGPLTIDDGYVMVNGSLTSSVVVVDGTLGGTGTVGVVTVDHGSVYAGVQGVGVLRTQSLTLGADSWLGFGTIDAQIDTELNQVRVSGAVTLNDASLFVGTGPQDLVPGTYVLVDNDGTDPVVGSFANAPHGTMFTADGRSFRVSYTGGDGNDIVGTLAVTEHHLSEGATGAFFDTDLLIANPTAADAPIEARFLMPGGDVVTQFSTVPALSRVTMRVDEIPGLANTEVSTIVTSTDGVPLIVERTMRWDASGYGAHTEKAVDGLSKTWYFAEGSQGFFSTYLLLANPNTSAITATVEYFRESGSSLTRHYDIGPQSRLTIDASADPGLVNESFGMKVTFSIAAVAERSMYFGDSPLWKAGHESAGVPLPSTTWFLAEGATGPFFETYVLIANPNDADAEVTVTFLPETGIPIVKTKQVAARGRLTINTEGEDAALANAAVATRITSTQPIVVERAQYWPDPAPQWYEAHNSFGVTHAGRSWGLAEGRVGGPEAYQTYILLANPGDQPSTVTVTFLREGKPSFDKTFAVPPTSRFNVSTGPGSLVPELDNERFGAKIASTQPIVVERAMYANVGGQVWAAGTNATATQIP